MNSPVTRNRNIKFLLRELFGTSLGRRLAGETMGKLTYALTPVASLAWWISLHAPELSTRESLKVAILGAEGQDAADDGRWYSLLPWLLGNDSLKVTTTLVGVSLFKSMAHEMSLGSSARSKGGTEYIFERLIERDLSPAMLARSDCGSYLSKCGDVDLVVLFNPGFEEFEFEGVQWLSKGQLDQLSGKATKVAVFSFDRIEYLQEKWLLEGFGFEPVGSAAHNPFSQVETPGGRWAGIGWQMATNVKAPSESQEHDLVAFGVFMEQVSAYLEEFGELPAEQLGEERDFELDSSQALASLVALPPPGTWADPETGAIFEESAGGLVKQSGIEIPPAHCDYYPGCRDEFEQVMWAMDAFEQARNEGYGDDAGGHDPISMSSLIESASQMSKLLREMHGEVDDGRVFSGNVSEMASGLEEAIFRLTGKRISGEEFMRQTRQMGGLHGPTAIEWFNLLRNLDWNLQDDIDEPDPLQPAFYAVNSSGSIRLPVVCERNAYLPGDDGDELVNEAKRALAEEFPEGVVLTFKSMPCIKKDDRTFSFGGLLYLDQQWRPFALCPTMKGLDALLAQRQEKFSFNAPDPKYEDRQGALAIALNLMTHGCEANDRSIPLVKLSTGGDWYTLTPDRI